MNAEKEALPKLQYQRLEEVKLIGVSSAGPGVIEVAAFLEDDPQVAEERVRLNLYQMHWWFRDYWKRQQPIEHIVAQNLNTRVDLFNFDQPLKSSEIAAFNTMFRIFANTGNGFYFHTFLMGNEDGVNTFTGEPINGHGDDRAGVIQLYPAARREIPHRIERASNFLGTLIHEEAHGLHFIKGWQFEDEWEQRFGWQKLDRLEKKPGGQHVDKKLSDTARAINVYATGQPAEDIAEHLTAAVFMSDRVDPQRLAFLRENFSIGEYLGPYEVRIERGSEIVLPRLEEVHYFKTIYQGKSPVNNRMRTVGSD